MSISIPSFTAALADTAPPAAIKATSAILINFFIIYPHHPNVPPGCDGLRRMALEIDQWEQLCRFPLIFAQPESDAFLHLCERFIIKIARAAVRVHVGD